MGRWRDKDLLWKSQGSQSLSTRGNVIAISNESVKCCLSHAMKNIAKTRLESHCVFCFIYWVVLYCIVFSFVWCQLEMYNYLGYICFLRNLWSLTTICTKIQKIIWNVYQTTIMYLNAVTAACIWMVTFLEFYLTQSWQEEPRYLT